MRLWAALVVTLPPPLEKARPRALVYLLVVVKVLVVVNTIFPCFDPFRELSEGSYLLLVTKVEVSNFIQYIFKVRGVVLV